MPFKHCWEKTQTIIPLPSTLIREIAETALSAKEAITCQIIEGGAANLNIKLTHKGATYLLRIYLRDPKAAQREEALHKRLAKIVPAAEIYLIGSFSGYTYALMQYRPGLPMREVLIHQPEEKWQSAVTEAGELLGLLKKIAFPSAGFFGEDLSINTPSSPSDLFIYARTCLNNPLIEKILGTSQMDLLEKWIEAHILYQPNLLDASLVHGDYDPANILIEKTKGSWHVSAILDWEFAFSGSWLWDVSNMLRYAHQVTPTFQASFLQGLKMGGLTLPESWQETIKLCNVTALLDCLNRPYIENKPKTCADIKALMGFITGSLK